MSEPMWCHVTVKVPATWVREDEQFQARWNEPMSDFVTAFASMLLNGSVYEDARVVSSADSYVILHADGEGNYGLADDCVEQFLDWCKAHRIPYDAGDEAKYEFPGTELVYRGGDEVLSYETSADTQVLDRGTWQQIRAGKHAWAGSVDEFFDGPPVPALADADISHLPAEPPAYPYQEEAA